MTKSGQKTPKIHKTQFFTLTSIKHSTLGIVGVPKDENSKMDSGLALSEKKRRAGGLNGISRYGRSTLDFDRIPKLESNS